MKKVIVLVAICLMALSINAQSYVDLGLPSGTKWKSTNEKGGFLTYDEAISKYGDKLPTREQYEELKEKCTWVSTGNGCNVYGPNGNYIYMPAMGSRGCDGSVYSSNTLGYYLSSTRKDSGYVWYLFFAASRVSTTVSVGESYRCGGYSIRLVHD